MTIRELHPSEFYKLADNEWLEPEHRPVPGASRVLVAENGDGTIEGFVFVSTIQVIEPIWVAEKHRFGTVAKRLFERARGMISGRGFMTHATGEKQGEYLERLGLQRTNWTAYLGRN